MIRIIGTTITIIDAIRELCKEKHPTSSWGIHDYDEDNITDLSVLKIDGDDTELLFTFDDVEKKQISMQAEYDAQEYARDRIAEYNALNQFEMQFDDKEDGTTTWEDAIAAIKTKYPKG
jgi:hypothetical protein